MYACDCVRAHACVFASECTRVLFIHSNLKRNKDCSCAKLFHFTNLCSNEECFCDKHLQKMKYYNIKTIQFITNIMSLL